MSEIKETFNSNDNIQFFPDKVVHESAGGFVFFESPTDHILFVALLQKEDGSFFIPKGHIQKNENPEEAALRETKEELQLRRDPKIITKMGVDSYTFNWPDDGRLHYKNVHLFIFSLPQKSIIRPLESEDFVNAEWLEFNNALEKISFDKENLLKARQYFYFYKSVNQYDNLTDIKSVSVGVPTYNGSKTIYHTLESILKSLNVLPASILKEMVVCLDHCNDNTEQVVKNFISKADVKIRLIYNDGLKGKSTALNRIFNNTKSNLICFVDDDVILRNDCILNLIKTLINQKNIRCVFAKWIRKSFVDRNWWKRFWHWVLGIKFDIQPYDQPSEIVRGACIMMRRENFVYLPDNILNDDQFIQYIYWPKTKEVQDAIIYFNSVSSISDYYKRFIRIMAGSKQLEKEFTKERIKQYKKDLYRKLDYKRILKLPLKQKLPFLFYRFIRFFINIIVKIRLNIIKDYEWFRIKQN